MDVGLLFPSLSAAAPQERLGHDVGLQPRGADHDAHGAEAGEQPALGRPRALPALPHRGGLHQGRQQLPPVQDGRHHRGQVGTPLLRSLVGTVCLCLTTRGQSLHVDYFYL